MITIINLCVVRMTARCDIVLKITDHRFLRETGSKPFKLKKLNYILVETMNYGVVNI